MSCSIRFCLVWISIGIFLAAAWAHAEGRPVRREIPPPITAPQFGPDVEFDPSCVPFRLADVRGKMVLIVFCVAERDGPHNTWMRSLLTLTQETYGGNPSVILVAMMSDVNGTAKAGAWLRDHGVDLSKWVVCADKQGAYAKHYFGYSKTWGWVMIDAKGRQFRSMVIGGGGIHRYQPMFREKEEILRQAGGKPLLGVQPYPVELNKAALAGEFGQFSVAMKLAQPMVRREGEVGDAAKRLVETTLQLGRQQVADAIRTLSDENSEDRYDAFSQLNRLAGEFRNADFAKQARDAINGCRGKIWLANEMAAEREYDAVIEKAMKRADRAYRYVAGPLREMANRYPQTLYGRMAVRLADEMDGPRPEE